MSQKVLDVICIGRIAIDLYGEQIGGRLEDMSSFAKYVGGSSGNMCIGMARQGLRTAMLSRVGDEHMGRFIREQLVAEGVDVSHLITDETRLTGLVLLGIRDRHTFPLIFYREHCADMAINEKDFDKDFIASAKALVVSGTHLSTEVTKRACETAITFARKSDTRTVLDIDYWPSLWRLTGLRDAEERSVLSDKVSKHLQSAVPHFDLILGTPEEFLIAGGSDDLNKALRNIRAISSATLVVKRGEQGVSIFPGQMQGLDDVISVPAPAVEICNVFGAADGFTAGFMRGWINDESLARSARYGSCCGALVGSRHGCSPAIPGKAELDHYLAHETALFHPDSDPVLRQLHRVATRKRSWNEVCILAFDHRRQLEEVAHEYGVTLPSLKRLKELVFEGARRAAISTGIREPGIIVDGTYGAGVLTAATGTGWFIGRPVELSGSRPILFECGDDVSRTMRQWPSEHVAKCLVVYSVDDDAPLRTSQEQKVLTLFEACVASSRELLLEVIPPANVRRADESIVAILKRFYDIGVFPDWWKLPEQPPDKWGDICKLIQSRDLECRGIVILGLDAPIEQIAQSFSAAAGHDLIKGFAIGRSIFYRPAKAWLSGSIDDDTVVQDVASNFSQIINLWSTRNSRALLAGTVQ